jgi:antitoxin component of MazEF toxin-antitoxin module
VGVVAVVITFLVKLRRARVYKSGGTLFAPLPSAFTKMMGVRKGTPVDIYQDNKNNLIIKIPGKKKRT